MCLSGSPPPSEFPPGGSPTSGGLPAVGSSQGVEVSQRPAKGTVDQSKHGHKDTDNEIVASTPGTSNKVVSRTSKLRLSASSSAVKPRTSWCPVVLRVKKVFEVHTSCGKL